MPLYSKHPHPSFATYVKPKRVMVSEHVLPYVYNHHHNIVTRNLPLLRNLTRSRSNWLATLKKVDFFLICIAFKPLNYNSFHLRSIWYMDKANTVTHAKLQNSSSVRKTTTVGLDERYCALFICSTKSRINVNKWRAG